jgi:hypothetical protein
MRGSSRQLNDRGRSSRSTAKVAATVVQGTEAVAAKSLKQNQNAFGYPTAGFVSRIEYSLLYSMISRPDVYPATVVLEAIGKEDFSEYLPVVQPQQQQQQQVCSYAQLSGILALAAEKFPPPLNETTLSNSEPSSGPTINVPKSLCQALLQCVIRHAQRHDLDRETEVADLLAPLQRIAAQKGTSNALAVMLPMYAGFGATILAGGNPIPMWIGYGVAVSQIGKQEQELQVMRELASTTSRMANVETTSLLLEQQSDDDDDDDNGK